MAFGLTLACPSFGYIDGGTGSILLQAAISGFLGALFIARTAIRELPLQFRRRAVETAGQTEQRKAA